MAVKTFTSGEVLTALDTNTYLANSGLVHVAQVVASNSATVAVNNCFSSTYDAYKIVITEWSSSLAAGARMVLGSTTTGYYWSGLFVDYLGAITSPAGTNQAYFNFNFVTDGTTNGSGGIIELQNPYLARNTTMQSAGTDNRTTGAFVRLSGGYLANLTSYTGFTFFGSSGNQTCRINVYGYRKGN